MAVLLSTGVCQTRSRCSRVREDREKLMALGMLDRERNNALGALLVFMELGNHAAIHITRFTSAAGDPLNGIRCRIGHGTVSETGRN